MDKIFTVEESKILLAVINDSLFKGQAAEIVTEIKKKLHSMIGENTDKEN